MKLRLSTIAIFNSCVLFSVALALAFSTWWGLNELRKPYSEQEKLVDVTNYFKSSIKDPISLYLESGDALLLSAAEDGARASQTASAELPEEIRPTIENLLSQLLTFLNGDFRAAGKLSGDPQSILHQNERETRDELSLLIKYALDGYANDPDTAKRFIELSTELMELVHERATKRERFFASLEMADLKLIETLNKQASTDAKLLRELPLLGIFEEAEADFGLSLSDEDEERADIGEELVGNVNYLIGRYIDEINRTQTNIENVSNSRKQLQHLVSEIDSHIEHAKDSISSKVDESFSFVQTIMTAIIFIIILLALLIDFIQRSIVKRINTLVPYLREYAEGDFRQEVEVNAVTEEVQTLSNSANRLRDFLSGLVGEVQERTDSVDKISATLVTLAKDVSDHSTSQLEETSKISVAIEQMSYSFQDVAENAAGAAGAATDAERAVHEGNALVQNSVTNVRNLVNGVMNTANSVKELSDEAQNIDSVITVIETIAEQTNLLALNAAIEAARAGEQGRGFAVVADEVRSLSLRTSESTQEIKAIIERLQDSARNTVDIMDKHGDVAQKAADETEVAGARLDEIVSSITLIKDMNNQIASTTEEQAAVASDINNNIAQIKSLSQETSESAQNTEKKAGNLQDVCNALAHASNKFKV
jgi:methyl-accepting chemotaxis protein